MQDDLVAKQGDKQYCPRCGREIVFGTDRCEYCDLEFHEALLFDPYRPIRRDAAASRAAFNRPGNRIILIGIWLIWGLITIGSGIGVVGSLWFMPKGIKDGNWPILSLGFIVCSFWAFVGSRMLIRTTRGYLGKNAAHLKDQ